MSEGGQFDLPKVAKAVAELGRASVVQKKWQSEVRSKAEAAAAQVEKIARKGGLNADTVAEIRREILGWRHEARPQANPEPQLSLAEILSVGKIVNVQGIPRLPAALGRHPRPAQGSVKAARSADLGRGH
ncbi:phage protein Gp27 family protein [Ectopseudomonas oleovorans]|uniref:phage protein Gp27 family protein n=1 Tax=Ectopseudomonas oleovorans TaxID=301 RepID=UPI003F1BF7E9